MPMPSWNRPRRRARLTVRKAVMHDIPPILDLINGYAAKGIMLPRTEFEMSEAIRDFTVVMLGRQTAGLRRAALLQSHGGRDPLPGGPRACQDPRRGPQTGGSAGDGSRSVRTGCGLRLHLRCGIFRKVGFQVVERGVLPLKAWKDCVRCPKFQACDEIAVLRVLRPEHWALAEPQPWGPLTTSATTNSSRSPHPASCKRIPSK